MILPTIHMNGDSPETLLEDYRTALEGISNAQHAMQAVWPNARNYYPQGPGVINDAIREHAIRLQKLDEIYSDLMALAEHVQDFIAKRNARRAERTAL